MKALAAALVDAFRRAFQGALFAIWVPPAATYVIVFFTILYQHVDRGHDLGIGPVAYGLAGSIPFAGLGFLAGAMLLAAWGFPVLFCLRLLRVRHPLVASVAAASLTFWKMSVAPWNGRPFSEDSTIFVVVAAVTAYAAAHYANIELSAEKKASI